MVGCPFQGPFHGGLGILTFVVIGVQILDWAMYVLWCVIYSHWFAIGIVEPWIIYSIPWQWVFLNIPVGHSDWLPDWFNSWWLFPIVIPHSIIRLFYLFYSLIGHSILLFLIHSFHYFPYTIQLCLLEFPIPGEFPSLCVFHYCQPIPWISQWRYSFYLVFSVTIRLFRSGWVPGADPSIHSRYWRVSHSDSSLPFMPEVCIALTGGVSQVCQTSAIQAIPGDSINTGISHGGVRFTVSGTWNRFPYVVQFLSEF